MGLSFSGKFFRTLFLLKWRSFSYNLLDNLLDPTQRLDLLFLLILSLPPPVLRAWRSCSVWGSCDFRVLTRDYFLNRRLKNCFYMIEKCYRSEMRARLWYCSSTPFFSYILPLALSIWASLVQQIAYFIFLINRHYIYDKAWLSMFQEIVDSYFMSSFD